MSDFDKCPICTNFRSVFRKNFGTSVIYVKNCISGEMDTTTEKNEKISEHSLMMITQAAKSRNTTQVQNYTAEQ